jgi:hypothetical protein
VGWWLACVGDGVGRSEWLGGRVLGYGLAAHTGTQSVIRLTSGSNQSVPPVAYQQQRANREVVRWIRGGDSDGVRSNRRDDSAASTDYYATIVRVLVSLCDRHLNCFADGEPHPFPQLTTPGAVPHKRRESPVPVPRLSHGADRRGRPSVTPAVAFFLGVFSLLALPLCDKTLVKASLFCSPCFL